MQSRGIGQLRRMDRALELFAPGSCPAPELIRLGLIPPLPLCGEQLLWGFPVLAAAAELGLRRLSCRLLPGLGPPERLAVALRLEARSGSYSWAEKHAMLRYLQRCGAAEAEPQLAALSPLIEGHPEPQLPRRLASYQALPAHVRQEVDRGRIDLKTALQAARLPAAVLGPIAAASLSFSQRRELLQGVAELALRDGLSERAAAALTGELLAARQPLRELEARRLPTVSGLRRSYEQLSGEALAGSGVTLRPPPWFEGQDWEVSFSFSSCRSLRRRLAGLKRLAERCDELVELLG